MDPDMNKELDRQILKFNLLFKKYDSIYRKAARGFNMCELEFLILYVMRTFISRTSKCTQKDLTDILLHPKQSINSALKSLVQKGYIVLKPCPDNGRIKYIYLTQTGKEISGQTADLMINAEKRAFSALEENERASLIGLFNKLTVNMEEQMRGLNREKTAETL